MEPKIIVHATVKSESRASSGDGDGDDETDTIIIIIAHGHPHTAPSNWTRQRSSAMITGLGAAVVMRVIGGKQCCRAPSVI